MFTLDDDRYLAIQGGAVALAAPIRAVVEDCLSRGATDLCFAGTGGAGVLMQPAARLLQQRSTLPVRLERPAELVLTGPVWLGPGSVVVIPSLSGTTAESVQLLAYAHDRGATVIALTGHADSPLARQADYNFTVAAADDTSSESFYIQSLLLALAVLDLRGEMQDYAAVAAGFGRLPVLLLAVKEQAEASAEEMARVLADHDFHIVSGAGSTWPEAFYYGTCILEEMQWIRTRPIHGSDFFHGTLELVEPGVSVVLLRGEDAGRPLIDRVEVFARAHTEVVTVVDSASFELPGLSAGVRSLVSPVVLAAALERISARLEVRTDHPLTMRRYYRRIRY